MKVFKFTEFAQVTEDGEHKLLSVSTSAEAAYVSISACGTRLSLTDANGENEVELAVDQFDELTKIVESAHPKEHEVALHVAATIDEHMLMNGNTAPEKKLRFLETLVDELNQRIIKTRERL